MNNDSALKAVRLSHMMLKQHVPRYLRIVNSGSSTPEEVRLAQKALLFMEIAADTTRDTGVEL